MAQAVTSCPLCAQPATHLWSVGDRNRAVSLETFSYARCTGCAVIFLEHPPADLGRYYPETYYELQSAADLEQHASSEQHKVDLLLTGGRTGHLTEIGPGQGVFAFAAKRAGFDVTGIEMDERACRHLTETVGVSAVHSRAPHEALAVMPPQQAVALWHVLEHLHDPWALVSAAAGALAPGGLLALSTPNPRSIGMRVLGRRWPHIDAPRHLFLIPADALRRHAALAGLTEISFTTDDPGGRHWNRFGWEYAMRSSRSSPLRARFAAIGGLAGTLAALPLERREGHGAAYTIVFRKNGSS